LTNPIISNLSTIHSLSEEKQEENNLFKEYLRLANTTFVDSIVVKLNNEISPQIDCTSCGNCCKSLMVNVNEQEANNLSAHLKISRSDFDEKYIEKGSSMMILNSIPCHFLANNACTVYEHRFGGCKEFPALHLPNFRDRIFTTFMHYDRCPIIFNVVEQLKEELHFEA